MIKATSFYSLILAVGVIFILSACSRKSTPSATTSGSKETSTNPAPKKPKAVVIKTPVPKSIVVNDKVAKKSVDGRLYYDLEGKRYWKNYKDGKYYLYHVSMHNNPDFKPTP